MPPQGHCPDCGAQVGAAPGEATPRHQPAGEREQCSGFGKAAT